MSIWFDDEKGVPATHDGTLPDNWFDIPMAEGGGLDPMKMLSGAPSFRGGAGGSAFSSASSTAIMDSPFTVGGSGAERMLQSAFLVVGLLGVVWLFRK